MKSNHTGTLYSFRDSKGRYYHTTDCKLLKEIATEGVLQQGKIITINQQKYIIKEIAIEVFEGVLKNHVIEDTQFGEKHDYSSQAFIYIEAQSN